MLTPKKNKTEIQTLPKINYNLNFKQIFPTAFSPLIYFMKKHRNITNI